MPDDAPSAQPPAQPPAIKSADDVAEAMARASQGQDQDQPQPPAEPFTRPPVEPTAPAEPAAAAESAVDSDATATPAEPAVDQPDPERRKLLEFVDQGWGHNFGQKYRDDAEFITGAVHADKLLGQRNEDAIYGRNVRQHEAEFREFLRQRQAPQQGPQHPPQPPGQVPPPQPQGPSWEQIKAWRNEVARDGENASPQAREGMEQFNQDALQTLHELRTQPGQFAVQYLAPHLAPGVAQVTQQTMGQVSANMEETNKVQGFVREHKDWLYQNGQVGPPESLTPDGKWVTDYALALERQGYPGSVALDYAHKTLFQYRVQQQQQNQPVKPKPVKPAAQHQPAVAAPTGGDPEEQYKQDLKRFGAQEGGLADHLAKLAAAGQLQ
jgi:hypothetical protein